jgi:2-dehydro-3-deoxygalactonokinase
MEQVAWIAVDWGTSNCRAWAMSEANEVVAEATSDKGMGQLERDGFEPALLDVIGDWLSSGTMDIFACGMVGSRQGWIEAGYRSVPCTPLDTGFAVPRVCDTRLRVRVVPGLKQENPPDVMRGEETQIAGFLDRSPDFDGVLCLPGTHAKWVQISAGEVVSFRTFMTGELFAAISRQTVLRHSLGEGWNESAFAEAVADALARPESLAHRLFTIRAEGLIANLAPAEATARLSGLLIGAELAASRPYWLGQRVALIADGTLARRYDTALGLQGVQPALVSVEEMTLAGLSAARAGAKETTP